MDNCEGMDYDQIKKLTSIIIPISRKEVWFLYSPIYFENNPITRTSLSVILRITLGNTNVR